jgi:fructose-1,6-bisphosphatase I
MSYNQSNIITIERHILQEQQTYPEATGVLTNILYDLALAGKFIASQTTRAGLSEYRLNQMSTSRVRR